LVVLGAEPVPTLVNDIGAPTLDGRGSGSGKVLEHGLESLRMKAQKNPPDRSVGGVEGNAAVRHASADPHLAGIIRADGDEPNDHQVPSIAPRS
jgi:hypothetical protein